MTGLVRALADIALLRRDPSGLPSSWPSIAVFVLVYASADVAVARVAGIQPVLARTAADLALTLPFFWLLLAFTRRAHRFPQTINAVLGVYVLLAPIVILLLLLRLPARSNAALSLLVTASYTVFVIWYLLVVGHILRSALDTGLVTGFAIAVTWLVASIALSQSLFGAPA
ncbi:MAG TPA: hypothetical protein VFU77_04650 [Steroidobacteraceae bacterium]|nr:hypothetical protein [Steroidobacteraceae bacterium]